MKKGKIKNQILKLINVIAVCVFLCSSLSLETATTFIKPIVCCAVSFGWLVVFCYANIERFSGGEDAHA